MAWIWGLIYHVQVLDDAAVSFEAENDKLLQCINVDVFVLY